MSVENNSIEIIKACIPIYANLSGKVYYTLSIEEIKCLSNFKVIWDNPQNYEARIYEEAGMGLDEYVFLGGYLLGFTSPRFN